MYVAYTLPFSISYCYTLPFSISYNVLKIKNIFFNLLIVENTMEPLLRSWKHILCMYLLLRRNCRPSFSEIFHFFFKNRRLFTINYLIISFHCRRRILNEKTSLLVNVPLLLEVLHIRWTILVSQNYSLQ